MLLDGNDTPTLTPLMATALTFVMPVTRLMVWPAAPDEIENERVTVRGCSTARTAAGAMTMPLPAVTSRPGASMSSAPFASAFAISVRVAVGLADLTRAAMDAAV